MDEILQVVADVNGRIEQIPAEARQVRASARVALKIIESFSTVTKRNAASTDHMLSVAMAYQVVSGQCETYPEKFGVATRRTTSSPEATAVVRA